MRILTCRGLIRWRSFASNSRFCRFAESKLILNSVLSFSGFTFLVVLLFRLSFYAIVLRRFLRFSFVVLSSRFVVLTWCAFCHFVRSFFVVFPLSWSTHLV